MKHRGVFALQEVKTKVQLNGGKGQDCVRCNYKNSDRSSESLMRALRLSETMNKLPYSTLVFLELGACYIS